MFLGKLSAQQNRRTFWDFGRPICDYPPQEGVAQDPEKAYKINAF